MNAPIIISSILLLICITILCFGIHHDDFNYKFPGIVGIFSVAFIGFGMICNLVEATKTETIITDFKFAQTESLTLIEINNKPYTFTDAAVYNKVKKGEFKVKLIQGYNAYGFKTPDSVVVEVF